MLTSTSISGIMSATATNGGTTTILTGAHVDITQYDTCIGSLLYSVDGETDAAAFTASEDGSSASLDVLIHAVESQSHGAVDVTVSARWSATAKQTKQVFQTKYQVGDAKTVETIKDLTAPAIANATVTMDFTGSTNYSVGASIDGTIQQEVDTTVTTTKK